MKRRCCGVHKFGKILDWLPFIPDDDSIKHLHFTLICSILKRSEKEELANPHDLPNIFLKALNSACKEDWKYIASDFEPGDEKTLTEFYVKGGEKYAISTSYFSIV